VTCVPGVRRATAVAAFTSLFTTFFWWVAAFLFTPPWPEHAPRPDETDVVPSLQIVAAACACSDPAWIVATAAIAAARIQCRDLGTLPPRFESENHFQMQGIAYARRETLSAAPYTGITELPLRSHALAPIAVTRP
jgi:hypothetical protein